MMSNRDETTHCDSGWPAGGREGGRGIGPLDGGGNGELGGLPRGGGLGRHRTTAESRTVTRAGKIMF